MVAICVLGLNCDGPVAEKFHTTILHMCAKFHAFITKSTIYFYICCTISWVEFICSVQNSIIAVRNCSIPLRNIIILHLCFNICSNAFIFTTPRLYHTKFRPRLNSRDLIVAIQQPFNEMPFSQFRCVIWYIGLIHLAYCACP